MWVRKINKWCKNQVNAQVNTKGWTTRPLELSTSIAVISPGTSNIEFMNEFLGTPDKKRTPAETTLNEFIGTRAAQTMVTPTLVGGVLKERVPGLINQIRGQRGGNELIDFGGVPTVCMMMSGSPTLSTGDHYQQQIKE